MLKKTVNLKKGENMKYLLILLTIFSKTAFSTSIEVKGLICAFGEKRNVYETYLFFEKKYISKYLFIKNDTYEVRQNEKRNYSITKNFINIKPFLINKNSLKIIDTEFNSIIGSCEKVDSHKKAIEFIHQLKEKYQNKIDQSRGRILI